MFRYFSICVILVLLISSCRKNEIREPRYEDDFFNKNLTVQANEITASNEHFTLVDPSGGDDEAWIDKSITALKKINSTKNFSGRIYKGLGQPIWNQSHVITGADSVKSIMTPIYKNNEVSGIIFSFHTSKGFKSRILPRTLVDKFRDTARSMHQVTKSTLKGLFSYFDNLRYFKNGKALQSTEMQSNTSVNNYPIVYRRCWAYAVGGSGNTVIFQIQCDIQVYWGSPDDWYWFSNNDPWADGTYWESYNQDEIDKAEENNWESQVIDTLFPSTNDCLNSVIRRLMMNDTSDFGKMVRSICMNEWGFTYYPPLDIIFEIRYDLPANRSAMTTINTGTTAIIKVNGNMFRNCSDLFVAQCLMHEFYHAYVGMWTYLSGAGTTDTSILNNFPDMFSAYALALQAQHTPNWYGTNSDTHEYLANFMVDYLTKVLAEYDGHKQDDEYYWCLAWTGLQETTVWQNHVSNPAANNNDKGRYKFALTTDRMNKIIDIIHAEKDHSNTAKSALHNFNNCY